MEKFTIGLIIGVAVGAIITTNSYKMRTLVKKGQEEAKQCIDELIDEKLKSMSNNNYSQSNTQKSNETKNYIKEENALEN